MCPRLTPNYSCLLLQTFFLRIPFLLVFFVLVHGAYSTQLQFSCINVVEEGADKRLNNYRLMSKPEDRDALLKVLEDKCSELGAAEKKEGETKGAETAQQEEEAGKKD